MPIFQFTDDDGETHHFEAPNEESAYKVLALLQGGPQEEGVGDTSASRRLSSSFGPAVTPQGDGGDASGENSLPGVGKAFGAGLASGAIRLAGIPGDIVAAGGQLLGDQSREPSFLGTDHLRQLIQSQTGPFYKPRGELEEGAEALGEATPAAVIAPHGSMVRTLARVAAPEIADYLSQKVLKGTPLETPARVVSGALRSGADVLNPSNLNLQHVIKSALLSDIWRGVTGSTARARGR